MQRFKLRNTVIFLLLFEILDGITTIVGLNMGFMELNPLVYRLGWSTVIILKVIITVGIAIVLQVKREHKLDYVIPCIAAIVPLWNSAMLLIG